MCGVVPLFLLLWFRFGAVFPLRRVEIFSSAWFVGLQSCGGSVGVVGLRRRGWYSGRGAVVVFRCRDGCIDRFDVVEFWCVGGCGSAPG